MSVITPLISYLHGLLHSVIDKKDLIEYHVELFLATGIVADLGGAVGLLKLCTKDF